MNGVVSNGGRFVGCIAWLRVLFILLLLFSLNFPRDNYEILELQECLVAAGTGCCALEW